MAIDEAKVGGRENGFGGRECVAQLGHGGILQRAAEPVEFEGESLRLVVGPEVGGGDKEPPQQRAGIVGASQGLADFAGE